MTAPLGNRKVRKTTSEMMVRARPYCHNSTRLEGIFQEAVGLEEHC